MGKMTSLGVMARCLLMLGMVVGVHQASTGCKNCATLGKGERAMFRAHSDACMATSHATPAMLGALCRGELKDAPELRAHVYCVLLRCKLIGKDGKLQKAAVVGKVSGRRDGKDITKLLESCSDQQTGSTPEDLAWNLFLCAYEKKGRPFCNYMPTSALEIGILDSSHFEVI